MPILMEFPTLMGSVGGWVLVVSKTLKRRNIYILVRHIDILHKIGRTS